MNRRFIDARQLRRVVFFAVLAFLVNGSWAYVANLHHGWLPCLSAGLTQGLLSFISTMILTSAMEYVFSRMPPGTVRFVATGLGPITVALLLMGVVHFVVETPEILASMLLPIVMGYAYALLYAAGLTRSRRPSAEREVVE